MTSQKEKCCYCEKNILDDEEIEHFRPKAGYQQQMGDRIGKPGYYWLAYEWSNLLCICGKCNRRKGNQFPIHNPGSRIRNHLTNPKCGVEIALIINPAIENPVSYFRFIGATIEPVESKSYLKRRKAKLTIDIVDLNRDTLFKKRASLHTDILVKRKAYFQKYNQNRAKREFKEYLLSKIAREQEFSLMVRKVFAKDLK
jgi:uncharacterized protein (TIGR02646 family)